MKFNYSFDRRPVWYQTVTVGRYGTHDSYRQAFTENHIRLGDEASMLLKHVELFESPISYTLCVASVSQLIGVQKGFITHAYMVARIRGITGRACPLEMGLAFRLEYLDQPNEQPLGESIVVAADQMNPFVVRSARSGLALSTLKSLVRNDTRYAFVLPESRGRI